MLRYKDPLFNSLQQSLLVYESNSFNLTKKYINK